MSTENKINSNFYQVAVVDANADVTGLTVANITATISANLGTVTAVTITGGSNGQVLTTDGSGSLSWSTPSGGGGTPGGTNTQIQFNDGGVFAGNAGFTYDTSTQTVTLGTTSTPGTFQVYTDPIAQTNSTPFQIIGGGGIVGRDQLIGGTFADGQGKSVILQGGFNTSGSGLDPGSLSLRGGLNVDTGARGDVNINGNSVDISSNAFTINSNAGTSGQVLTSQGSSSPPIWSTPASTGVTSFSTSLNGLTPTTGTTGTVVLAGTLGAISGGTSQSTYATGDILFASNTNTLSKRAIGSDGQVLTVSSGVPVWATASAGGGQDLISYSTCGGV